ncbi:uncharacterized protein DSM5745_00092 [Aspergillus mulundensis]|uniref:Uncharacterized protein n=1 Tax=Aspergillus mulundensis TaxID=1810919 RepID=A0A3D8T2L0_9EURO|nr:hypothetical protein DSM5745_00092 [Aspergillus mulundensis]RDW92770.1 hypothetical protein DSM5745_00092 [Aspergillus mulundensis]
MAQKRKASDDAGRPQKRGRVKRPAARGARTGTSHAAPAPAAPTAPIVAAAPKPQPWDYPLQRLHGDGDSMNNILESMAVDDLLSMMQLNRAWRDWTRHFVCSAQARWCYPEGLRPDISGAKTPAEREGIMRRALARYMQRQRTAAGEATCVRRYDADASAYPRHNAVEPSIHGDLLAWHSNYTAAQGRNVCWQNLAFDTATGKPQNTQDVTSVPLAAGPEDVPLLLAGATGYVVHWVACRGRTRGAPITGHSGSAYNTRTGTVAWRQFHGPCNPVRPVAIGRRNVYYAENSINTATRCLIARDIATGVQAFRVPFPHDPAFVTRNDIALLTRKNGDEVFVTWGQGLIPGVGWQMQGIQIRSGATGAVIQTVELKPVLDNKRLVVCDDPDRRGEFAVVSEAKNFRRWDFRIERFREDPRTGLFGSVSLEVVRVAANGTAAGGGIPLRAVGRIALDPYAYVAAILGNPAEQGYADGATPHFMAVEEDPNGGQADDSVQPDRWLRLVPAAGEAIPIGVPVTVPPVQGLGQRGEFRAGSLLDDARGCDLRWVGEGRLLVRDVQGQHYVLFDFKARVPSAIGVNPDPKTLEER